MVCKCCVPGCKSNYESAGKEGRCRTFGFPLDETNRQNCFVIFQDILKILLGIPVFVYRISRKRLYTHLTYIQTMMDPHIG